MSDKPEAESEEADEASADRHFAAIGRVASNWAYFELVIDDWCFRIADINRSIGSCFTTQVIGPSRKVDAFIALAGLFAPSSSIIGKLHEFAHDQIMPLSERRNRVVHDPWFVAVKGYGHRYEITARRKLREMIIKVSTDDVLKLARQIEEAVGDFHGLAGALYDEVSASSKRPPSKYVL
jgi:hypothetical protein